jgi:uncharacterized protein YndB with AHSA1/START domain
MMLNDGCGCNACVNVSNLDLKFFVHYGRFGIQRLSAHDELVGSDVNLIHRLLKNHVTEETGFRAYSLFTDAAIQEMGLQQACEMMTQMREAYEHLGEVVIWVQDMQPVWKAGSEKLRIPFPEEQVAIQVVTEIAMPPELVWDYLAALEFRRILLGADRAEVVERKNGRVAEGTAYRCYHGDRLTISTVLEWRPFERLVTQDLIALPGRPLILCEYRLEPVDMGTRLTMSFARPTGGLLARIMLNAMVGRMRGIFLQQVKEFKDAIERDREGQVAIQEAVGELE